MSYAGYMGGFDGGTYEPGCAGAKYIGVSIISVVKLTVGGNEMRHYVVIGLDAEQNLRSWKPRQTFVVSVLL